MYRKAEDVRVRVVDHAQGGMGSVTFYDWLLPDMNYCKEGDGHSTTNNSDQDLVLMALIMNA